MISGSPGFDNRIWLRAVALFQRLPELAKRLDRLEKALAKLIEGHLPVQSSEEAPSQESRSKE
jgi:hypothetical protein